MGKEYKNVIASTRITELSEEEFSQYKIALAALWHLQKGHSIREMLPDLLEYGDTSDIVDTFETLEKYELITGKEGIPEQITEKARPIIESMRGQERKLWANPSTSLFK